MSRRLDEVVPGLWVATAEIWATTSTVVLGEDHGCLLVDPAVTPAEVDGLAAAIIHRGLHVVAGFSTHAHWDHLLWSAGLGTAPRWAGPEAAALARRSRDDVLAKADGTAPGHDHGLTGDVAPLPAEAGGALRIPWSGPTALVLPHRAHSPGHAAVVLPGLRAMLAGDMLSDREVPLLDLDAADPVGDYRRGLDVLEGAAHDHGVELLVPGHGTVGDRTALGQRLGADRAYLDAVETGHDLPDERLADPWVAEQHRAQLAHLR